MNTPQESAKALAAEYGWEVQHQLTVTRIALELFDQMSDVHGLGIRERIQLECAALMHDIGWVGGQKRHHRRSAAMILEHGVEGLGDHEILVVAAIARYHRKALPDPEHEIYRDLNSDERRIVRWCSGILRIADGLDRAHDNAVSAVRVRPDEEMIELAVTCSRSCDLDIAGGQRKVGALEAETGHEIRVVKAR
jgi:exopolyphosphatase/guanosine-5'-triphosphate,3'-diphosphate pyrophosphatase